MRKSLFTIPRLIPAVLLVTLVYACTVNLPGQSKPTGISIPAVTTPSVTPQPTPDPLVALWSVCQGKLFPEAAEYLPNKPPHRVYFVPATYNGSNWNDQVPPAWHAATISEVELVGCISEEAKVIETCSYFPNGKAYRTRYDTTIRLVVARTGEEIVNLVQSGTFPESCPGSITSDLSNPPHATIPGGHVAFADIQGSLKSLH